ncbi:unnamed protein product [Dracunculus medinensis]|uniref:Peptidase_M13 domain-containing protein n=1 Tax=Dracunculus medinensis TaxID=318479 RepID=A0A0N4UQS2_DRAME|nr:unnamed protein product [Dracunculus medinensis]
MGSIIGHEIIHGFDDQGSQFDLNGNLHHWWDNVTKERFDKHMECFIKQYSAIEVPGIKHNINGILTQGENAADNAGFRGAYRAYRKYISRLGHEEKRLPGLEQYSADQMFFISYARNWCGHSKPEALIHQVLTDPHVPSAYRVNVVLSNQPNFAELFKCPLGSPMNPHKQCKLW